VLRQERLTGARSATPPAALLILAVAAVTASTTCGPAAGTRGGADDPEMPPEPSRERADHYGGPVPSAEPTSDEEALWAVAVGTNPSCRCVRDPRLILTARRHAADLSSSRRPPNDTDLEHLRFAMRALGGIDYGLQPLVIDTDDRGRQSLAAFVLANGDRWTHCGLGIAGTGEDRLAVWIGVERTIELGPVPVRPPVGVELEVVGRTLAGRPVPIEPYLGLPDGTVQRLNQTGGWSGVNDGRFEIGLPLTTAGRYEFELLADTGRGPETTVLLPLYVGVEPEPGPVITLDAPPGTDSGSASETLAELIERERSRLDLAELARDPRLDRIAEAHSRDMVSRGFFGHRSPDGKVLADRLRFVGLTPRASAENIARSRSVARVHRNLMASPSHRINIVDPRFTHLGIGVARDGDDVVITEIFARW
jgi:uncharacterized protein YkwD